MKIIFVVLFVGCLFLCGTRVTALETYHECINATHLYTEIRFSDDGVTKTINQTAPCQHRCNNATNECNPLPMYDTIFLWPLGFMFLILGLALIAYASFGRFDKEEKGFDAEEI